MIHIPPTFFPNDGLVLTGHGVELRPLVTSDAEALADAANEDRASYDLTPVPDSAASAARYIDAALAACRAGRRYPFAVRVQGRLLGSTSYADYEPWHWPEGTPAVPRTTPEAVEVGYTWYAASAQRTACNTACKLLLLTHAFEVWRVHRVCLQTDVRNARSRAAIERIGARLDGIRRAHKPGWDGAVRDSIFYSIVISEWPDIKRALIARL